jgi:hypothetical protein
MLEEKCGLDENAPLFQICSLRAIIAALCKHPQNLLSISNLDG